ncbi:MAG: DinB family protein, partial [Dehalococcoidia bacterium]
SDSESWSPRKIVHHLADAETIASTRVRRLVAETDVHVVAYDEALWARTAHYERPIASALALIAAVRTNTAEFLRSLTEAEWQREGTHSEAGRYTPETWLRYYAQHAHDHAAQVRAFDF